jgi:ferric-dicitrate binding protein FerR (iron transport regulator)
VSKKLSREKRREMRDKGTLEGPDLAREEARKQRRAEEQAAARSPIALQLGADPEPPPDQEEAVVPVAPARKRNDRTVFVLAALVLAAGLIMWLMQRSPRKDATIDVPPPPAATK